MNDPHPHLTRAYVEAADRGDLTVLERIGALLDAEGEKDRRAEEDRLNAPGALGRAAEFYADHGFPVFPLVPGGKAPAVRHGLKDATTDLDVVRAWWTRRPDANIGIRTGPAPDGCGYDVIDLDGLPGVASWYGEDLTDAPDVVGRSRTTRPGGWHLWTPATGRGNRAAMMPGVDYRGAAGFVVAPPSRRAVEVGADVFHRRWRWVEVPPALTAQAAS